MPASGCRADLSLCVFARWTGQDQPRSRTTEKDSISSTDRSSCFTSGSEASRRWVNACLVCPPAFCFPACCSPACSASPKDIAGLMRRARDRGLAHKEAAEPSHMAQTKKTPVCFFSFCTALNYRRTRCILPRPSLLGAS